MVSALLAAMAPVAADEVPEGSGCRTADGQPCGEEPCTEACDPCPECGSTAGNETCRTDCKPTAGSGGNETCADCGPEGIAPTNYVAAAWTAGCTPVYINLRDPTSSAVYPTCAASYVSKLIALEAHA